MNAALESKPARAASMYHDEKGEGNIALKHYTTCYKYIKVEIWGWAQTVHNNGDVHPPIPSLIAN